MCTGIVAIEGAGDTEQGQDMEQWAVLELFPVGPIGQFAGMAECAPPIAQCPLWQQDAEEQQE